VLDPLLEGLEPRGSQITCARYENMPNGTCLPHLECTAETQRNQMKVNQVTRTILGAAIEVHRTLGHC